MSRQKKVVLCGLLMAICLLVTTLGAKAQLDKILKGGGIAFLITQFGKPINSALNKLTRTRDDDPKFATKVVPVLSVGSGAYAGAVQVAGPRAAVDRVQAVAQFETKFSPLSMRIRALVPIATKSVTDIRRVPGVGVSGLLDVKL
jgi:hypothetical protein